MKNLSPREYSNNNLTSWVTPKYIVGSLAYWAIQQHPYGMPDNLVECLNAARIWLEAQPVFIAAKERTPSHPSAQFDMATLHSMVRCMIEELPAIRQWNLSKAEKDRGLTDPDDPQRDGMSFVSRYDEPAQEWDFIDLGALARNVTNLTLIENFVP